MRYGCCVGPAEIEAAADAGYDFVEMPVGALLPETPEAEFAAVRERLKAAPIKPEVWRLGFPPDMKLTGQDVDWPRLARYAYTAVRRAAAVGGAVLAFSDAPARRIPEGFPRHEAMNQLAEFLGICGTAARSQGLVVGIEPLLSDCCNCINSLPEAVSLARKVNLPEVGVLPNAAHMISEHQPLLDVVDAAEWLAHIHIATTSVSSPEQGKAVGEFAAALRLADYDWRLSATDEWRRPVEQLKPSLQQLRSWFEDPDAGS